MKGGETSGSESTFKNVDLDVRYWPGADMSAERHQDQRPDQRTPEEQMLNTARISKTPGI